MQELTEQQIERANEELAAMADGWILSAEGWRDIAPHLQYAPAPVDGDVIDIMCGTFQIAEGNGVKRMAAAAQVLQSRHDAELAEYKKAMGPVTDEEWPYQEHAPVDLPRLAAPYITRQYADAIFEHRRALLEKKPEPTIPSGLSAESYLTHVGYADSRHSAPAIAKLMQDFESYRRSEPKP